MHIYNRKTISLAIVAIGYITSRVDFENYIISKKIKEKYELDLQKGRIAISGEIPERELNNFLANAPIISYKSAKYGFSFDIIFPERKISIVNPNFDEKNNLIFEEFVNEILDENLSKIQALGINYNAIYEKENKLKLFNKNIESTEFFKNNITFNVMFPINYTTYTGTYTIEKICNNNENETEKRDYAVSVNYNFNLKDKNAMEKCTAIPEHIKESSQKYFNLFSDTADEFLNLDYEKQ